MRLRDYKRISGKEDVDVKLKTVDRDADACDYIGCYGLTVVGITRKQFQDLLDGKLLADPNPAENPAEYGTVIRLIEEG